jgi:hypothetical protein
MVARRPGWLTGPMLRNAWRGSLGWMLVTALGTSVGWGPGAAGPGVVPELAVTALLLAGAVMAWLVRPSQRVGKVRSRQWLLWPATLG